MEIRMANTTPGTIIVLNGCPSAGKTSIAKAIQRTFEAPYLHVGIDLFWLEVFPWEWAAAGITRVIRSLPESWAREKQELALHLKDILDGCLAHQHRDGLFHDVIDQLDTFTETNLAQMLAYSIYRGVCGGWLPSVYKENADKMRSAVHQKVDASGYVQGVSAAPAFDRAGTAPEGQAFFLLIEAAWKETT